MHCYLILTLTLGEGPSIPIYKWKNLRLREDSALVTLLSSAQLWHCLLPMPFLPLESAEQSVAFFVFKEKMLEMEKKKVLRGIFEILRVPLPFSLCTSSPNWQRWRKNGSEDSSLEMTITRLVPRDEKAWQILSSLSLFQSTQTSWDSSTSKIVRLASVIWLI